MRKSLPLIFISVAILGLFSPAMAAVILEDHFDNGELDPAWTVSSINVSDWAYSESGTQLAVTDITPIVRDPLVWGKVILSRTLSQPMADFHLDFDISWDSEGAGLAYQNLYVTLRDSSNNIVALAAYQDPWDSGGQRLFIIKANSSDNEPDYDADSEYYWSGTGSLPLTGSAKIGITRSGGNIQFFWDDVLLFSGTDARAITQMDIQFWGIDCLNGSFFGTESVDLVRLTDGAPVLVPPISDAGVDQVVFDTVTLDGSASNDSDGSVVSYEWKLQHRANPEDIRVAYGMTATVSALNPGFYDVILGVTDDDGLTSTDTMLLAVAGQCIGWPSPNTNLDLCSFWITKNKRNGRTFAEMLGSINLPKLAVTNGDTVQSRITIELFDSLPGGGDLIMSEEASLKVNETTKRIDIHK